MVDEIRKEIRIRVTNYSLKTTIFKSFGIKFYTEEKFRLPNIDEIDQKILRILQEDARIPYREIGEKIGVAESTARKRVAKLIEKGVIERFRVDVNPAKIGKTVTAFITIYPIMERSEEIIEEVVKLDEVIESYYLSGRCGFFLKVNFTDIQALNDFIAKIRGISGIRGINTCIALETIKK